VIRRGKDRNGKYRVVTSDDPEALDLPGWNEREWAIRDAMAAGDTDSATPALIVRCLPGVGCGDDGKSGESLARVYRTPLGMLWCSEVVVAHDALPTFREMHADAMVMRHPITGGVSETTRGAFERVWQAKGWFMADPSDLPPQWRPQRALLVRDLVDRDDHPHVSLRVSCSVHRAAVVDRQMLLGELSKIGTQRWATRPWISPLSALCPLGS
jgi:hypothetical protein